MFFALLSPAAAYEAQVETLDNGDTLVVVEDDRADLVKIVVRFRVGDLSPYWRDNHLRDAWGYQYWDTEGLFRERAEELVADISLDVNSRNATISALCMKEDAQACADLLGDILRSEDLSKDELKRSRKGQSADWKSNLKDPEFILRQATQATFYVDDDPRAEDTQKPARVSTKASKNAAAKMAVVHTPDRILGFSGNVSLDEAKTLAEGLVPDPIERLAEMDVVLPERAEHDGSEVVVDLPDLTQTYFRYYRPGLVHLDENTATQRVAHYILTGHFYSRMGRAMRHDSGLTYGVGSSSWLSNSETPYSLSSYSKLETGDEAVRVMRETLATFHAEGVTAEELAEAQSYLDGKLAMDNQAPWNLMWDRIDELSYGWPEDYYRNSKTASTEVTLEEVNAWIAEFYDPADFTLVRVVPSE